MAILEKFVSARARLVQNEDFDDSGCVLVAYEFERGGRNDRTEGNAQFTYDRQNGEERQNSSFGASLCWSALAPSIEGVVGVVDTVRDIGAFDALYAYDEDDFSLQNFRMAFALEHYGLDRQQVEIVKRVTVDEIETRYNPGYFRNVSGLHMSIQWLNYWSAAAQREVCRNDVFGLSDVAEVREIDDRGGVRVRLAKRPGRYDDAEFHTKQLEVRRRLGLLEES